MNCHSERSEESTASNLQGLRPRGFFAALRMTKALSDFAESSGYSAGHSGLWAFILLSVSAFSLHAADAPSSPLAILKPESFAHHITFFNTMENEPVVNVVPNAESWA